MLSSSLVVFLLFVETIGIIDIISGLGLGTGDLFIVILDIIVGIIVIIAGLGLGTGDLFIAVLGKGTVDLTFNKSEFDLIAGIFRFKGP